MMIYALKLLFAVLIACGVAAFVARRPFRTLLTAADYRIAWMTLIAASLAAFLSRMPLILMVTLGCIAAYGVVALRKGAVGAIGLYLLLGSTLPPIWFNLNGFGDINSILRLDPQRVLALVLLATAALRLFSARRPAGYGSLLVIDLGVVGYYLLQLALTVPHANFTMLARQVVETFLDNLLPYYVATRAIRTLADLRFVASYLQLGLLFGASVAALEFASQQNFYTGLQGIYDTRWQLTWQLFRGGLIRVQAMAPSPLLLAVALVFSLGLWVWLKGRQWRKAEFLVAFAIFIFSLIGTWSRGPWLACGILFVMLLALQRLKGTTVGILLLSALVLGVIAKAFDADVAIANSVGALFGGSSDDLSTIDYRRQLLDTSIALIKQSPWFGVPNYAAQMQDLRQGEGIIDLVNSYVGIALNFGVVGLALYLAPFVVVIYRLLRAIRRDENGAVTAGSRFATAFVALNVACLFAIFTTSTFGFLPTIMTLLFALPATWLAMPEREREATPQTEVDFEVPPDPLARFRHMGGRLT